MNDKLKLIEKAFGKTIWQITKYASEEDQKGGKFYEEVRFAENILVNQGINALFTLLCSGASGTRFSEANANLIVGIGTATASVTDVEGTFNGGVKKAMESGYPTYGTNQKATWKASYGTNQANIAWQEFGVLDAAANGRLLNRKVSNQGTKIEGQVWDLSLEITLS